MMAIEPSGVRYDARDIDHALLERHHRREHGDDAYHGQR